MNKSLAYLYTSTKYAIFGLGMKSQASVRNIFLNSKSSNTLENGMIRGLHLRLRLRWLLLQLSVFIHARLLYGEIIYKIQSANFGNNEKVKRQGGICAIFKKDKLLASMLFRIRHAASNQLLLVDNKFLNSKWSNNFNYMLFIVTRAFNLKNNIDDFSLR